MVQEPVPVRKTLSEILMTTRGDATENANRTTTVLHSWPVLDSSARILVRAPAAHCPSAMFSSTFLYALVLLDTLVTHTTLVKLKK